MTYPVVVQELTATHAMVQDVQAREEPLTVPRAVVKVAAAGTGVLLLAAGRVGATEVAVGVLRRGVHLGIVDSDQNTTLHLAIMNRHVECALALIDFGYVDVPLAQTVRHQPGRPGLWR